MEKRETAGMKQASTKDDADPGAEGIEATHPNEPAEDSAGPASSSKTRCQQHGECAGGNFCNLKRRCKPDHECYDDEDAIDKKCPKGATKRASPSKDSSRRRKKHHQAAQKIKKHEDTKPRPHDASHGQKQFASAADESGLPLEERARDETNEGNGEKQDDPAPTKEGEDKLPLSILRAAAPPEIAIAGGKCHSGFDGGCENGDCVEGRCECDPGWRGVQCAEEAPLESDLQVKKENTWRSESNPRKEPQEKQIRDDDEDQRDDEGETKAADKPEDSRESKHSLRRRKKNTRQRRRGVRDEGKHPSPTVAKKAAGHRPIKGDPEHQGEISAEEVCVSATLENTILTRFERL